MESKFKYRLSQKADADLDEIVSYIAVELANPQAASDFVDKLQSVIDETCYFPDSGALVGNEYIPHTEVRKKMVGNYIMYYLSDIEKKVIYVVRIVYCRRSMDEILRQLNL